MYLIIGLGNPGEKYDNTRHNIGFMVLDELQQTLNFPEFKEDNKMKAFITKGEWNETPLILAKPTTFMNRSGEAAQKIANFYKIPPENIFVIYDDVDLPTGKLRIRTQGSAGTHNGMKSLIQYLGNTEFARFRIGIECRGTHAAEQEPLNSFVLGKFTKAETEIMTETITNTTKSIQLALKEDLITAMNTFNTK